MTRRSSTPASHRPPIQLNRRTLLGVGLAGIGVLTVGCNDAVPVTPKGGAGTTLVERADAMKALSLLERELPGRIGVHAMDTTTQAGFGYRAEERFLLCSTAKTLVVAAVLQRSTAQPDLLNRVIEYRRSDVLDYAPVTSHHVGQGMTVAALCDAAITVSDNTAANLLVEMLGGPQAVTAFARTLGDTVTRIDRLEPDLNVTSPGDLRDTSTPAQMATNLRTLVLGDALAADARERLTALLKANTTGNKTIRAGLPREWTVGDKTGSGAQGENNDIAVAWPPDRPPLVISVYTSPEDPNLATDKAHDIIARAAHIAVSTLTAVGN